MTPARILIMAGSDSGGGAGIQADIKAVTALGGFAMAAITALTAQNTRGVQDVMGVPTAFIERQMAAVLEDIGADCLKTGMLHDVDVIETVAGALERLAPGTPLVLDPVMVAQSGDRLIREEAVATLRERLLPRATLLTPNAPEAEVLLGERLPDVTALCEAAEALRGLGADAVLVKGGHLAGETVVDVLATAAGTIRLEHPRIATRCDHGTGCTLASAIAEGIGRGLPLEAAVRRGRAYLQRALETATPLGGGHGPVNHGHTVQPFQV
ncbi:bifunctional hydroxymethylpyrimidine kinase/phosphomethylpyrimidine kinase [Sediminicurvatus halobius]|uniref:hydroxymethylpyrimidine kinase n=1 Tax=Sediminicurvatus halobius TaxID=2182432 RepID=A0A2U2MWZ7_9GAMM|nr:bifunctional hydroxymethylpyrimidine kinase/phosphomethylpyrimidine kinase [Spiribacter halobius]PWG61352.1 bifunctional hydroxymethylpyrimidine kinase/phosphomethylpyrimidine kinase [Spiribacter halobius]UEX76733.1 bifunctional hydroxymethylpyrimidine kinase/phosphomethylpyrimidine kinase [Spiribacter halobius]